jgi:hypothetical protein
MNVSQTCKTTQITILDDTEMPPRQRITPKTKMSHVEVVWLAKMSYVEVVWLVTPDRALDRICPLDFDAPASEACLYA